MIKNRSLINSYSAHAFCAILIFFGTSNAKLPLPVISAQEEMDLELFEASNSGSKPFFQLLDKTQTLIGRKALKNIVQNPLRTKQALEHRQSIIKEFIDSTFLNNIKQELITFNRNEHALYNLWQTHDSVQKAALQEFYFTITPLKQYNASPALLSALQVLSVGNMFGPLIEHALLHFFISNAVKEKYHIGCNHDHAHDHNHAHASPTSQLVYTIYNTAHFSFHLMNLKGIYDHIMQKAFVIKSMQEQLICASQCIHSMRNLYRITQKNPLIVDSIAQYSAAALLFDTPEKISEGDTSVQLIEILSTDTFKGQASVWSNIGNVLAAYHLMENAHALRNALDFVGIVDAHASIAQLYNENKTNYHPYTFAEYASSPTPIANMVNVWNPNLGNKCCTHTMHLGASMPNTSIITGDNAAGKSTMIKSMALAILLGQTFTIAPADFLSFSPFAKISTSIKHADNIQAGTSLFITEQLKAQSLLDTLGAMDESDFSFAIFDELFKSTSFEKGQKTAYELIETLAHDHPRSLTLVATHYEHLTSLQEKYPALFKNYLSRTRTVPQGTTIFELIP